MAGVELHNFNIMFMQLWNPGHDARLLNVGLEKPQLTYNYCLATVLHHLRLLVKCDLNPDDKDLPALGAMNDVLRLIQLMQMQLTLRKPMVLKPLTTRRFVQLL